MNNPTNQNPNSGAKDFRSLLPVAAAGIGLLGLCAVMVALAGSSPLPGEAVVHGKSLAQWQELYWRWAYGQVTFPADANGNALVEGNVVLMPLPATPGDGTPGSLSVTLKAGQAFVFPLWNVLGTSYADGTPNDPRVPLSVFQTLDLRLRIDGVTVISGSNLMGYYSSVTFDPPIPLLPPELWFPYKDIIWLQGIGIVHAPLSAGPHTITLDEKNTEPVHDAKGNAFIYEYHNTWQVTVH